MTKVYVASSWRNEYQPAVVTRLKAEGFAVYDFRNPAPGNHGFHWSEIDPGWENWSPEKFMSGLDHDLAIDGFKTDMDALRDCDVCVLVLPSGRSAHLEAGWAVGAGKLTLVLIPESVQPELMYQMFSGWCTTVDMLISRLRKLLEIRKAIAEAR